MENNDDTEAGEWTATGRWAVERGERRRTAAQMSWLTSESRRTAMRNGLLLLRTVHLCRCALRSGTGGG